MSMGRFSNVDRLPPREQRQSPPYAPKYKNDPTLPIFLTRSSLLSVPAVLLRATPSVASCSARPPSSLPSVAPVEVETGISIQLHKRGSLTLTLRWRWRLCSGIHAIVKAKDKYRQNLVNGGTLQDDTRTLLRRRGPLCKRQKESLEGGRDDRDDLE